jgi:hypothetical protein
MYGYICNSKDALATGHAASCAQHMNDRLGIQRIALTLGNGFKNTLRLGDVH